LEHILGNYIPGLCSGFTIDNSDLGRPLGEAEYPVINLLYSRGIAAFCDYAATEYAFTPAKRYLSKCHLCFDIRHHLVVTRQIDLPELGPVRYYNEI
jgi:hypothetical protein